VDGVRSVSRVITRATVVLVTTARGVVNGVRTAGASATSPDDVNRRESQGRVVSLPHSPRGRAQ